MDQGSVFKSREKSLSKMDVLLLQDFLNIRVIFLNLKRKVNLM
mgnify:CR=1 FL=1